MRRLSVLVVLICVCGLISQVLANPSSQRVLKVGVLFSKTGPMANSEKPLIEATLLGIDQVNELGVPIEEERLRLQPIVVDGASDPTTFAKRAEELYRVHKVRIIFGCWTSDCRKAVLKVVERERGLLFYPVQYEGGELSPNCVYSGLTANQQLVPALDWLVEKGRSRVFLVGSDYVYPRSANRFARQYFKEKDCIVVGERYRVRGSTEFKAIAKEILASRADCVLNTINGDSLASFFEAVQQAGVTAKNVPVLCTSMGEVEAQRIGAAAQGAYACCGYFMSLDSPLNRLFKLKFQKAFGSDRVVDDAASMACSQVWALAQAIANNKAHSTEPSQVREHVRGLIMDTPGGLVRYDPTNVHCWRVVRIARVVDKGQFHVVWSSELPLRPELAK